MKHKAHDDAMAEVYQSDPAYALELLNSVLADGDFSKNFSRLASVAFMRRRRP